MAMPSVRAAASANLRAPVTPTRRAGLYAAVSDQRLALVHIHCACFWGMTRLPLNPTRAAIAKTTACPVVTKGW